jgi:hypothetical protein
VPLDLEIICMKCLEKEPGKRYPSAEAFAEDLQRFLDGQPILARPATRMERTIKWARRRPTVAGLMAAVAATLLLSILSLAWALVQTEYRAAAEQQAQKNEDELHRQTENHRYYRRITQAQLALHQQDAARARELLDACWPAEGQADPRDWEWYYLRRLCDDHVRGATEHPPTLTNEEAFPGALASANSVLGPGGRRLATIQSDGTVTISDVETGQELLRLRGPRSARSEETTFRPRIAFSPDGRQLAVADGQGRIMVWDSAPPRPALAATP